MLMTIHACSRGGHGHPAYLISFPIKIIQNDIDPKKSMVMLEMLGFTAISREPD